MTAATPEELPGYLLTRGADVYGRCVALVGRGDAPAASGTQAMVRVADLRRTANHRLDRHRASPTRPSTSSSIADLRAELAKQSRQARDARKGVWAGDRTQKGVDVESLATLTDDAVLLPKLFRRLVDYLAINDRDVVARRVPGLPRAARGPRLHPLDRHLHRLRLRRRRPRAGRAADDRARGPRLPGGVSASAGGVLLDGDERVLALADGAAAAVAARRRRSPCRDRSARSR